MGNAATTDLLTLDRKLALAVRALDAWRDELPVDDRRDKDDPTAGFSELTQRSMIEAIGKSTLAPIDLAPPLLLPSGELEAPSLVHADDPLAQLRPAVSTWCTHLHIARGLRDATVARASAMRDELDSEVYGRAVSIRAMLRALARPRQAGGVPEGRAAATIEDLSPQLLDSIVDEESRRREAAEGLGVPARCCREPAELDEKRANTFLAATEDEANEALAQGLRAVGRQRKGATWVDALAVRRAADVAEGWPSALGPRWLAELSRGTELLDGLKIDVRVDAGRLAPHADHNSLSLAQPTGAWTFARALYALGVALRIHGRDAKAPFSTHVLPHDLRPFVMGEAFMALAVTPVFHGRARGVSRPKAEASARRLVATRLLERRHLALRVRLASELARGRRAFLEAFEEHAPRAFGVEVPRELAAFLGAPGPLGPAEDAARLAATEHGDILAQKLVEVFDVDWWRNPKAASWVRERCAR
jgi:hypothetical protein